MKKIAVLLLLVLVIVGCQMYKTKDVVIENKSHNNATIRVENFKENDKKILSSEIIIPAHRYILLPMYHDGNVTLNIGRNYLKKISNTYYEILNTDSVKFTIYNKTDSPILVKDLNNLFDIQLVPANGNKPNIDVYNIAKVQPVAITSNGTNLILKVLFSVSGKTIVVSY